MELINPNELVKAYLPVIAAFKKRADVQNGKAIGYHENQSLDGELKLENWPKSIGFGLSTTGFCVSASQALLFDKIFQILLKDRGAVAKIVSIDIKEQYYGNVYNGSQNKWHSALLVKDNGQNFIIDLTCRQFGNMFQDKDIWDFQTWEQTFRSPVDKHVITDFEQNVLNFLPIQNMVKTSDIDVMQIENRLHSITTITDGERKMITDFFLNNIEILNTKLILGNINKFDYKYLDNINKLLKNLNFKTTQKLYSVLEFNNKQAALNFIENLSNNNFILQQFMILSKSIEDSCQYSGINMQNINDENGKAQTYVVFEFDNVNGIEVDFISDLTAICIPYGIKLTIDPNKDIFNGGQLLPISVGNIQKKTNSIWIKCSN